MTWVLVISPFVIVDLHGIRLNVCQHACVLTYENRADICIAPDVYVGIYDWKIKLKLGVVFCMPLGLILFGRIIFQKLCFDLTFNCN